jgi:outer membrane protein TolC
MRTRVAGILVWCALFLSPPAFGLDIHEFLESVQDGREIRLFELQRQAAGIEADKAAVGTDPGLDITPQVKFGGVEDKTDPTSIIATATFGLNLPVGMTDEQARRLTAAREALLRAEVGLDDTGVAETYQYIRLYHTAWLAGENLRVAEAEHAAAGALLQAERARFERGEVSFSEFTRTDESFADKDLAYTHALAEYQEALSALSALPDLLIVDVLERPPVVFPDGTRARDPQKVSGSSGAENVPGADLPGPTNSSVSGYSSVPGYISAAVLSRQHAVAAAEREASVGRSPVVVTQLRSAFEYNNHTASISLQPPSRSLSLGYTPEGFILREPDPDVSTGSGGSSSGSSSASSSVSDTSPSSGDTDWSLTLSVSFSFSPERLTRLEQEDALVQVEQRRVELEQYELQIAGEYRALQNDIARAEDAVTAAGSALDRAVSALEIVRVRQRSDQIRPAEVAAAEASVQRAEYALTEALLIRDQRIIAAGIADGSLRDLQSLYVRTR